MQGPLAASISRERARGTLPEHGDGVAGHADHGPRQLPAGPRLPGHRAAGGLERRGAAQGHRRPVPADRGQILIHADVMSNFCPVGRHGGRIGLGGQA